MILAHGDLSSVFLAVWVMWVTVGALGGAVAVKLVCRWHHGIGRSKGSEELPRVPGFGKAFVIAAVTVMVLLGPLAAMFSGHPGLLGALKDRGIGTNLSVSLCVSLFVGTMLIAWACHTRLLTAAIVTFLAYVMGVAVCVTGAALCVVGMALLQGLLELARKVF